MGCVARLRFAEGGTLHTILSEHEPYDTRDKFRVVTVPGSARGADGDDRWLLCAPQRAHSGHLASLVGDLLGEIAISDPLRLRDCHLLDGR